MDYYSQLQQLRLINLSSQLQTPTLVRIDINLPVANGRVVEDALRMRVYAHILEIFSDYAGLVVMSHQGRKGDSDFTSLYPHWRLLLKLLPDEVDVDFIPHDRVFTEETRRKIGLLQRRHIILLDNVRYFDHEQKWNLETDAYVRFFGGLIKVCVNDAMPTWHRKDSSLMCLPHIAQTFVGMRSSYELSILNELLTSGEPKALIMGGAKLQKLPDLIEIRKRGVDIFTGGLPGQLIARAAGKDLGETNNNYLRRKFTETEFEDAKRLASLGVFHPQDFVVAQNGDKRNIGIDELPKSRGTIKDIGQETLELYSEKLQEKPLRVRAGPLGVYEENFLNGLELTKRIAGQGLIFSGGNTSQEVNEAGLLEHIQDSGGKVCISGGSLLHGWAGNPFPSLDSLLERVPVGEVMSS